MQPQNGHVSVRAAAVLAPLASGGLGHRWNDDVATGGQTFGEDIRFVKTVKAACTT